MADNPGPEKEKVLIDSLIDAFDYEAHWSKIDQVLMAKSVAIEAAAAAEAAAAEAAAATAEAATAAAQAATLNLAKPCTSHELQTSAVLGNSAQQQTLPLSASLLPALSLPLPREPSEFNPEDSDSMPKPKKRKSVAVDSQESLRSPLPTPPDPSSSQHQSAKLQPGRAVYEQRNIKFSHPFPTKSALTLSESQQFSQLLSLCWQNTVAAAASASPAASAEGGFEEQLALFGGDLEKRAAFQGLRPLVDREQKAFQEYAKEAHGKFPMLTCSLPDDERAYLAILDSTVSKRRLDYPDFYRTIDTVSVLPSFEATAEAKLTLEFKHIVATKGVRRLLNPHSITLSNAPNISTNGTLLARILPNLPSAEGSTRPLWKPPQMSADPFVDQLARRNRCRFALSCGTLKRLMIVDAINEAWEFPALLHDDSGEGGDGGGGRLVCIDAPLPSAAHSPSIAAAQARLAQLKAVARLTQPNKSGNRKKKQTPEGKKKWECRMEMRLAAAKLQKAEQAPAGKRLRLDASVEGPSTMGGGGEADDLSQLETFGGGAQEISGRGDGDSHYKRDAASHEESGAAASAAAFDAARFSAKNTTGDLGNDLVDDNYDERNWMWDGPAVVYSVLQLGPHRLLVRSRRPLILEAPGLVRLFAMSGRGFAPGPEAARLCARFGSGSGDGDCDGGETREGQLRSVPCQLRARLERQPFFGCEVPSPVEASGDWLSTLATGASVNGGLLLRTRCSIFDGRVLLYELLAPGDLAAAAAGSPATAASLVGFKTLLDRLDRLRLAAGEATAAASSWLLLRRPAGDPLCRIMLADANCREFQLPPAASSADAAPPLLAAIGGHPPMWRPLDTRLLSHPHWRDKRVPALFDPRVLSDEDQKLVRYGSWVTEPKQHQRPPKQPKQKQSFNKQQFKKKNKKKRNRKNKNNNKPKDGDESGAGGVNSSGGAGGVNSSGVASGSGAGGVNSSGVASGSGAGGVNSSGVASGSGAGGVNSSGVASGSGAGGVNSSGVASGSGAGSVNSSGGASVSGVGVSGGGAGGVKGGGQRPKDPQSRRSQKGTRWMERLKRQHSKQQSMLSKPMIAFVKQDEPDS